MIANSTPMKINPTGVDLVTGYLNPSSSAYIKAKNIASQFPDIPFPSRMESKY